MTIDKRLGVLRLHYWRGHIGTQPAWTIALWLCDRWAWVHHHG